MWRGTHTQYHLYQFDHRFRIRIPLTPSQSNTFLLETYILNTYPYARHNQILRHANATTCVYAHTSNGRGSAAVPCYGHLPLRVP
jgi:hypothetical protein